MSDYVLLDLTQQFNNDSISYAHETHDGAFNVWGNSFPAEFLPPSNSRVEVGGIPFQFPPKEKGLLNSITCCGQLLTVPSGRYDWMYILASSERRAEDVVFLHYESGATDPEWLRVSDFWPDAPARFGELVAYRTPYLHYPHHVQRNLQPTIWQQRMPIPRREPLVKIRLPDNVAIHLFAITMAVAVEVTTS